VGRAVAPAAGPALDETRAERRRRLRDERKAAKREAKTTVAVGADGATYLQDELFAESLR
jgi:hypothetical protein